MNPYELRLLMAEPRPQEEAVVAVVNAFNLARRMWREVAVREPVYREYWPGSETLRCWLEDRHLAAHEALRCVNPPKYVLADIYTVSESGMSYNVIPEGTPIDPNEPRFFFNYHPLFMMWGARLRDFFYCYRAFYRELQNHSRSAIQFDKSLIRQPSVLRQLMYSSDYYQGSRSSEYEPLNEIMVTAFEDALEDRARFKKRHVWSVTKHDINDWSLGPLTLTSWLSHRKDTAAVLFRDDFSESMLAATGEDCAIVVDWTGHCASGLSQQLHYENCWTIQRRTIADCSLEFLAFEDGQVLIECEMLRSVLFDTIRCELPVLYVNEAEATLVKYPLVPSLLDEFFDRYTQERYHPLSEPTRFKKNGHLRILEQMVDGSLLLDGGSGEADVDFERARFCTSMRDILKGKVNCAPDYAQPSDESGPEYDLRIAHSLRSRRGAVVTFNSNYNGRG
jgi:hypothetical protein